MMRKLLIVGLSLCVLSTNSFFLYAGESHFWGERRIALAATKHAAPAKKISLAARSPSHSPQQLRAYFEAVAQNAGMFRDVYFAPSAAENPFVFIIQDVHQNVEAQKNISRVFSGLGRAHRGRESYALPIGVEGAFGPFDFSAFRLFPDRNILVQVAEEFLAQGKIAAPSLTGITAGDEGLSFTGVDHPAHYALNVKAYQRAAKNKGSLLQRLAQLEHRMATERGRGGNRRLVEFERLRASYHRKKLDIGPYVQKLTGFQKSTGHPDTDPAISQFLHAMEMENSLDLNRVERERESVLNALASNIDAADAEELLLAGISHKEGALGFADHTRLIQNLARKKGVNLEHTPAFKTYIEYTVLANSISPEQLFPAIERLEHEVGAALAKTDQERRNTAEAEQILLTEKLLHFALTPGEWRRYQTLIQNDTDVKMKLAGGQADVNTFEPFEAFYREADERSQHIASRVISLARLTPLPDQPAARPTANRVAALLVGGFHTPDITAALKREGLSFAVIQPKITQFESMNGTEHLSAFTQEKTPIDQIFSGAKLFLAPFRTAVGTALGMDNQTELLKSAGARLKKNRPPLLSRAAHAWKQLRRILKASVLEIPKTFLPGYVERHPNRTPAEKYIRRAGQILIAGSSLSVFAWGLFPNGILFWGAVQALKNGVLVNFSSHLAYDLIMWAAGGPLLTLPEEDPDPNPFIQRMKQQRRVFLDLLDAESEPDVSTLYDEDVLKHIVPWREAVRFHHREPAPHKSYQWKYWYNHVLARMEFYRFAEAFFSNRDYDGIPMGLEAFTAFMKNMHLMSYYPPDPKGKSPHQPLQPPGEFRQSEAHAPMRIGDLIVFILADALKAGADSDPVMAQMEFIFKFHFFSQVEAVREQLRNMGVANGLPPEYLDALLSERQPLNSPIPPAFDTPLPRVTPQSVKEKSANAFLPPRQGISGHHYPAHELIPAYLSAMYDIAIELREEIDEWNATDLRGTIYKLAEFYQYGCHALLFDKVNNSILMNMVNGILFALGWKTVEHRVLDYEAIAFSPENFRRIFLESVLDENPELDKDALGERLVREDIVFPNLSNGASTPPIIMNQDTVVFAGAAPAGSSFKNAVQITRSDLDPEGKTVIITVPGHNPRFFRPGQTVLTVGTAEGNDFRMENDGSAYAPFHFVLGLNPWGDVIISNLHHDQGTRVVIRCPARWQSARAVTPPLGPKKFLGQLMTDSTFNNAPPSLKKFEHWEWHHLGTTIFSDLLYGLFAAWAERGRARHPWKFFEAHENPSVAQGVGIGAILLSSAAAPIVFFGGWLFLSPLPVDMTLLLLALSAPFLTRPLALAGDIGMHALYNIGAALHLWKLLSLSLEGLDALDSKGLADLVGRRARPEFLLGVGSNSMVYSINDELALRLPKDLDLRFAPGRLKVVSRRPLSAPEMGPRVGLPLMTYQVFDPETNRIMNMQILVRVPGRDISFSPFLLQNHTAHDLRKKYLERLVTMAQVSLESFQSALAAWVAIGQTGYSQELTSSNVLFDPRTSQFGFVDIDEEILPMDLPSLTRRFTLAILDGWGVSEELTEFVKQNKKSQELIREIVGKIFSAASTLGIPLPEADPFMERLLQDVHFFQSALPDGTGAATAPAQGHPDRNEDSFFVMNRPEGGIAAAVMDGVGGHAHGDRASLVVREYLTTQFKHNFPYTRRADILEKLPPLVLGAEQALRRDDLLKGSDAGCTLTLLVLMPDGDGFVANGGDSRAYLFNNNELSFLTVDNFEGKSNLTPWYMSTVFLAHKLSITNQASLAEIRTREEATKMFEFDWRHLVDNIIGGRKPHAPVITYFKAPPGSRVILTTDGVHDPLTTTEMRDLARQFANPQELADALIQNAKTRLADVQHIRSKGELGDDATAVVVECPLKPQPAIRKCLTDSKIETHQKLLAVTAEMPAVEKGESMQPEGKTSARFTELKASEALPLIKALLRNRTQTVRVLQSLADNNTGEEFQTVDVLKQVDKGRIKAYRNDNNENDIVFVHTPATVAPPASRAVAPAPAPIPALPLPAGLDYVTIDEARKELADLLRNGHTELECFRSLADILAPASGERDGRMRIARIATDLESGRLTALRRMNGELIIALSSALFGAEDGGGRAAAPPLTPAERATLFDMGSIVRADYDPANLNRNGNLAQTRKIIRDKIRQRTPHSAVTLRLGPPFKLESHLTLINSDPFSPDVYQDILKAAAISLNLLFGKQGDWGQPAIHTISPDSPQPNAPRLIISRGYHHFQKVSAGMLMGLPFEKPLPQKVQSFFLADDGAKLKEYIDSDFIRDVIQTLGNKSTGDYPNVAGVTRQYLENIHQFETAEDPVKMAEALDALKIISYKFAKTVDLGRVKCMSKEGWFYDEEFPIGTLTPPSPEELKSHPERDFQVIDAPNPYHFMRAMMRHARDGQLFSDLYIYKRLYKFQDRYYLLVMRQGRFEMIYASITTSTIVGQPQWERDEAALFQLDWTDPTRTDLRWHAKPRRENIHELTDSASARINQLIEPLLQAPIPEEVSKEEVINLYIDLGIAFSSSGTALSRKLDGSISPTNPFGWRADPARYKAWEKEIALPAEEIKFIDQIEKLTKMNLFPWIMPPPRSLTLPATRVKAATLLIRLGFPVTEVKIRILSAVLETFKVYRRDFASLHFGPRGLEQSLLNRLFVFGGTWAVRLSSAAPLIWFAFQAVNCGMGPHNALAAWKAAAGIAGVLAAGIAANIFTHTGLSLGALGWDTLSGSPRRNHPDMRFIQAAQAASNPERFKSARLFLEITLPPVIKLGVGRLSATEERAPARILLRVKDPAKDLAEEIAQMNKVKRPQDKVFIVSPTEQTASFGERAAEGARSGIFLLGIDESVGSKLTAANLKAMSGNLSYCRVLIDAAWLDEESGLRRSPDLFRALQALEDYDGSDFKTEFYFTLGRVVEKLLAIPFRLAEISRLEPLKNALIAIQA